MQAKLKELSRTRRRESDGMQADQQFEPSSSAALTDNGVCEADIERCERPPERQDQPLPLTREVCEDQPPHLRGWEGQHTGHSSHFLGGDAARPGAVWACPDGSSGVKTDFPGALWARGRRVRMRGFWMGLSAPDRRT